ncbi:MAG: protein-L-isoaspartate(D-aspartate) O-methyltransferase [Bacteroidales bacterium]|nr:protein-L-isoaspartate(D-aspartate) O-methyltransferase [Lentimicrobiaceae bacterium]MDD5694557.1 protein-L-isoaspartate(D-aspartate) O-methyltransferase [Bacteroidales bacterium]
MIDSFKHQGLRKQLIDLLRRKGIRDERVLQAMEAVPRHFFFESSFHSFAYDDKPFPIGAGQTISQPYTVAFQTELLDVQKGDKILEIGTGSGYQACILAKMGGRVYSIERIKSLYTRAKAFLPTIDCAHVKVFYGDGYKGLTAYAPFNKILITAAAPYIPTALIDQLTIGGTMVVPLGSSDVQIMTRVIKTAEGLYRTEDHGYFRFVPLLENKEDDQGNLYH